MEEKKVNNFINTFYAVRQLHIYVLWVQMLMGPYNKATPMDIRVKRHGGMRLLY
jgi:hypothetical protein